MGTVWQDFAHPTYPQAGTAPFIKGLSVLDLLFNCGPRAAEIARQARDPEHELLAA
jgi:WbqC-like protein family